MRLVYAKTVVEQAQLLIREANAHGKVIEKIVLTKAEARQLNKEIGVYLWRDPAEPTIDTLCGVPLEVE